jgi:hypothetical protein
MGNCFSLYKKHELSSTYESFPTLNTLQKSYEDVPVGYISMDK